MTIIIQTKKPPFMVEQEAIIKAGLPQFVSVGNALSKIRQDRDCRQWYKEIYGTFENYCLKEWGFTGQYATNQIRAASVMSNLETETIVSVLPATESQARPLTRIPDPDLQRQVWQDAIDTAPNGNITARHVEKTVKLHLKHAPPKITAKPTMNRVNENIEWAAWSWNPVTGCLHNCAYCYARDIANRFFSQKFEPTFLPERLPMPANTKQIGPRWEGDTGHNNIFVCSMADLFGKWVPVEWINAVNQVAIDNPQWTFLYLTKFPIRMAEFEYPPNVWLGTSVDRQHTVKRAEKAFTKIKASGFKGVCWLSCEPMLERLTFGSLSMFDWVVMGGASKSTQTPEYIPPFDDTLHLYNQARDADCKVYMKTNLLERVREYPGGTNATEK